MKVVAGEQEVFVLGVEGSREVREKQQAGEGDPCVAPLGAAAPPSLHTCASRPPPHRKTPPPLALNTPTTNARSLRAPPEEPCVLLPGVAGRLPGLMFLY